MTSPPPPYSCAICNSGTGEIVQIQTLALLNREAPCAINFGVCHGCGHVQQWPPVSPELMAHHYRTFASYGLFGEPEALRAAAPSRHAVRLLSLAHDIGLAGGRAYEVGCASGEMLNQFQRQGWEVRGCDPSPSAAAQAGEVFGITVDLGGEEQTVPRQQNLDLVLACHVLEHLYDPAGALARIQDALAPDGHLLLEVPCAVGPETLMPGWFTFEHLHYYQPAILNRLLQRAGFEPIEMRISTGVEHYPVVTVAARKTAHGAAQASFDPEASIALARQYAARDATLWASTAQKLAGIPGPVIVYGAGIHTAQLLDHTKLAQQAGIVAIVDRDSKKWGQTLAGKPVISPNELFRRTSTAPIIVSSYVSEVAIVRMLLDNGISPSRIVPLYSDLPA